ncbi:MAG: hydrogenase expression/formation protein HypE [Desulfohalobiaceae bacterium]|nr:hydrogenase expression/formation protein HypE [Desulfohalobiaceae bacterium]
MKHEARVLLDHGSGGRASQRLIRELFLTHLGNSILDSLDDAAVLEVEGRLAMSTDTFTVDPLFFPGGDIGSLAVHGTSNDLSMLGAEPLYLSCGFVLEEGLPLATLEAVVASMGQALNGCAATIVTGDTKVVPKGAVDKLFINTTGIGRLVGPNPPRGHRAEPGDAILISGTVGDHGLAVLSNREGMRFDSPVISDSAMLHPLVDSLLRAVPDIHVLRDPTRGGLATTLNEIAQQSAQEFVIQEEAIPVQGAVSESCSFLGLDPLYLANEGKFLCILPQAQAQTALDVLQAHPLGRAARRIGEVRTGQSGRVILQTAFGGERFLRMLEGEQLPRIC